MAIDARLRSRDMYYVATDLHDQRVCVGGWVYYVRAIKRPHQLLHNEWDEGWTSRSGGIAMIRNAIVRARDRRRPWLLGVVRMGDVATWNDIYPRVVHVEPLGEESIEYGVDRLVRDASAGRFAPAKPDPAP